MNKRFIVRARKFIKDHKLKPPDGFLKYVIFNYVEAINKVSDKFVFKGGNLLWIYINTPRATVDLDFSTIAIDSHKEVEKILRKACKSAQGITYEVLKFEKLEKKGQSSARAHINYTTEDGASNKFEIDIVYNLKINYDKIKLPIEKETKVLSASLENIIIDKIKSCHQFRSGNTRIKDFDDLFRIAKAQHVRFKENTIKKFLRSQKYKYVLDKAWISNEMRIAWEKHQKRYKDLPKKLENLFNSVNKRFLK